MSQDRLVGKEESRDLIYWPVTFKFTPWLSGSGKNVGFDVELGVRRRDVTWWGLPSRWQWGWRGEGTPF